MDNKKKQKRNLKEHISVCICTYKRPEMLRRSLEKIFDQITDDKYSFEVVITDNDKNKTAEYIVKRFQANTKIKVIYECEPEQNISLARNRAIKNSTGNLIAFIDDDEFPENNWLLNLLLSKKKYKASGILGPVIPFYSMDPPKWLKKSRLCERRSFLTGTFLHDSKYMRTGNVLLDSKILKNGDIPFDPKFGQTGGEDAIFFDKMIAKDHSFVWCNEGRVFEEVPKERQKISYHVKRALVRGVTSADQQALFGFGSVKSLIAVAIYSISLPFFFVCSRHLFFRYLIKDCDHIAKLFAQIGIKLVNKRMF